LTVGAGAGVDGSVLAADGAGAPGVCAKTTHPASQNIGMKNLARMKIKMFVTSSKAFDIQKFLPQKMQKTQITKRRLAPLIADFAPFAFYVVKNFLT
jgi:hypothetical protein